MPCKGRMTRLPSEAAAILWAAALFAAPPAAQTPTDEWKYAAYIYGYLPQLAGSATFLTGTTVNLSVDANKIISNLKFTVMGWLEAQKGPVGLFTDVMYVDVSGSKSGTRDLHIGDFPIPAGITADATLDAPGEPAEGKEVFARHGERVPKGLHFDVWCQ